jgi:hypothetical protein
MVLVEWASKRYSPAYHVDIARQDGGTWNCGQVGFDGHQWHAQAPDGTALGRFATLEEATALLEQSSRRIFADTGLFS